MFPLFIVFMNKWVKNVVYENCLPVAHANSSIFNQNILNNDIWQNDSTVTKSK